MAPSCGKGAQRDEAEAFAVEALKAERISSDDVLKAFTLWGFSESTYISRALRGRAPGVPVKCPCWDHNLNQASWFK